MGKGKDRMKRIALMLIAAMVIAVLPAAAGAQVDEEAVAAAKLLSEKANAVGCPGCPPSNFQFGLDAVEPALADVKAKAPGLDYAELDAAIVGLQTAIDGGDVAEMEAAAQALAAAAAGVVAEAEAEAGGGAAGVDSGGAVTSSPNVALLGVAAILLLLAGGALAVRWSIARR
jgi:hypothetical protein